MPNASGSMREKMLESGECTSRHEVGAYAPPSEAWPSPVGSHKQDPGRDRPGRAVRSLSRTIPDVHHEL